MTGMKKNVVWTVDYDPCEAPLADGAELTVEEIRAGIRLRSFVPGMVVRNKATGTIGVIHLVKGRLKLIEHKQEVLHG